MISRVQYLPLLKQESFLRAKYEVEGLSPAQIADLTFSSRPTVIRALAVVGITLRTRDHQPGPPRFGAGLQRRLIVFNQREQAAIAKVGDLRRKGLSYDKIATVLNTMGVRTRTGTQTWYAKTVRDIVLREVPAGTI